MDKTEEQHVVQEEVKQEVAANTEEKKEAPVSVRPEYSGDKGMWEANTIRDTPVETKTVAPYSFGKRVRIAALNTP